MVLKKTSIRGEFQRISSLPDSVKAGGWFTICGFLQKGISMITTPIFTRVLPEEEYGIVSTFTAWQSVINLIVTLTIYRAIMNLYVQYENKERVLAYVEGLSITISLVWTVVAMIMLTPLSVLMGMSKSLVLCMFLYSIGESIIQCWMIYKRYIYDYRKAVGITLLLTFISSFGGVVCVLGIRHNAEWRLYPQIAVYFIIGLTIYFVTFRRQKVFYHKEIWKFSLGFCVGLMPHYISEFILQSSDKIMINYLCGSTDVALYSIAYSVGSLILLFANAVNASFVPYQYQKIQSKSYRELAVTANRVQIFLAVILSLIMLFGKEIVLLFGGKKYISCVSIIVPICLGVYFNYMFQMFARVQEYYNKKITIVIPSILCALLNIILNYIFILKYGYKAASYTTFICFAVFCFIHYLFYLRTCKMDNNGETLFDGKMLLKISLGIVTIGFIILLIQDNIIMRCIFLGGIFFMWGIVWKKNNIGFL